MHFRPGSYLAALAHGFGLIRRADNPPVDEVVVIFHKPSGNYSSIPAARYKDSEDFQVASRLYKHSGPEITNIRWDIK